MSKFMIVPATEVEARYLAPRLRAVDRREVLAASGQEPLAALLESLEASDRDMRWAALLDGEPTVLFGVAPITENIGGIWMLASNGVYRCRKDFMRKCYQYVALMHTRYEYLTNFIDERNVVTRRWLDRLGFIRGEVFERFGVGQQPFVQYTSKRK